MVKNVSLSEGLDLLLLFHCCLVGLQHEIIWATQPNALPTDSPTIADKLQEAGYATHLVGKWHLGFHKKEFLPNNRGFHSFYGFLTGSENHYTHERCYKGSECFFLFDWSVDW